MTNDNTDNESQDLTRMLVAAGKGDHLALSQFIEATYNHLHNLAGRILGSEVPCSLCNLLPW